jgi:hypothetical protein
MLACMEAWALSCSINKAGRALDTGVHENNDYIQILAFPNHLNIEQFWNSGEPMGVFPRGVNFAWGRSNSIMPTLLPASRGFSVASKGDGPMSREALRSLTNPSGTRAYGVETNVCSPSSG